MAFKMKGMSFMGPEDRKEVRRENKQVRRLARLRKLEEKGKTDTKRYAKLKDKVYSPFNKKGCSCYEGYSRVQGTKPCAKGSCKKSPMKLKDACYYKAKKAHKVFPSAYASGMIAKCRKNK